MSIKGTDKIQIKSGDDTRIEGRGPEFYQGVKTKKEN